MDLWIRSQDKERLIKVEEIRYKYEYSTIEEKEFYRVEIPRRDGWSVTLGIYSTKEKALKVLEEIQNLLIDRYVVDEDYWGSDVFMPRKDAEIKVLPRTCVVYQMPADDTPPAPKDN